MDELTFLTQAVIGVAAAYFVLSIVFSVLRKRSTEHRRLSPQINRSDSRTVTATVETERDPPPGYNPLCFECEPAAKWRDRTRLVLCKKHSAELEERHAPQSHGPGWALEERTTK